MQQKAKEALEQFYLEALIREVPDFPTGQVVNHERPDFLIKSTKRIIGIEITRIYQRHQTGRKPGQAVESEQRSLLWMACRYYERMNLPPVQVNVIFSQGDFAKKVRPQLARELARIVAENLPLENDWRSLKQDFKHQPILPEGVYDMSITRYESITKNLWARGGAGFVQEDCVECLQQTISEKEAELAEYKKNCDSCWLLIVADGSGESSFIKPSEQSLRHHYTTEFERVYFLSAFSPNPQKLNIREGG